MHFLKAFILMVLCSVPSVYAMEDQVPLIENDVILSNPFIAQLVAALRNASPEEKRELQQLLSDQNSGSIDSEDESESSDGQGSELLSWPQKIRRLAPALVSTLVAIPPALFLNFLMPNSASSAFAFTMFGTSLKAILKNTSTLFKLGSILPVIGIGWGADYLLNQIGVLTQGGVFTLALIAAIYGLKLVMKGYLKPKKSNEQGKASSLDVLPESV